MHFGAWGAEIFDFRRGTAYGEKTEDRGSKIEDRRLKIEISAFRSSILDPPSSIFDRGGMEETILCVRESSAWD
jgi:hypothetical protein